ncbi:hypothetical protein [Nostoc sp.]|uniref:hypothetical protein n=1 Tax=Nostoc sp. TaxID=1180 RepID=UPI002FF58FAD
METSTLSLLEKCQENFPYIRWTGDKDSKCCTGIIENTLFSVDVTSVEGHSSVKLKIDMKEHAIDLIGKSSSEGKPIEALFAEFCSDWKDLNYLLNKALNITTKV